MNFSNKFKQVYWWILVSILTLVCVLRFLVGSFLNFDIFLFIIWFFLVLFPIISEISFFGISVKKEIDSVKEEMKLQFSEVRNSINNHQNQVVNVHTVTVPADKEEIKQKQKEDIADEKKIINKNYIKSSLSVSQNTEIKKTSLNQKVVEKQQKISEVEKLVHEYFSVKFGNLYKPQMKIEDVNSKQKVIVDAIIEKSDNNISKIVEIRVIGSKIPEAFYFIASRFIRRLQKIGIGYPVYFVVVSEYMDEDLARLLKKQIQQINFARSFGARLPYISETFFKLEDSKLVEVLIINSKTDTSDLDGSGK